MSLADVTSARSSPEPDACPECDTSASVTSDLHKYQVACTCKPGSGQYARADDPGPPPPAKTDTPPALPPRPPAPLGARRNNASVGCNNDTSCRRRKYAWWCCGCGALAAALGGLLAAQHILLRAYTASPHHLETVPAAVPAAMVSVDTWKYAWWCCGCGALATALGRLLAAQHILLRAYTASPHHLETVPAAVPAAMVSVDTWKYAWWCCGCGALATALGRLLAAQHIWLRAYTASPHHLVTVPAAVPAAMVSVDTWKYAWWCDCGALDAALGGLLAAQHILLRAYYTASPHHLETVPAAVPAAMVSKDTWKYAWWCCGCGALAAALGGLLAAQHILLRAYTASPHHLETVPAAVPAAMVSVDTWKYAWRCCDCGALAAALGRLLAAQHILLRAYTASRHHLEMVPAAVPAAMLVLTGVCIMSLARRRNRYSYMIKVVGACCLVCALTCVLVTITTTVIHMNKLQTLKFCEYTKLTRTCTCFSMPPDLQHNVDDDGVRCVFEGVTDCGVVHGALYWCLRGVFALSVSAVLVCIFSCMLAYQLLSHERKKMYWEQLELRCRSLYRPPTGQPVPTTGRPVQANCSCCAQCHPTQPAWDISMQHRFWTPGRIGNLYSPNPGTGRKTSAWSWFPWPRSNSQNSRCRMGGVPQSGDSAYGFCDTDTNQNPNAAQYEDRPYPSNIPFQRNQNSGTYPQNPQNQGSFAQNPGSFAQNPGSFPQNTGSFPQTPSLSQSAFAQSGFVQYVQEGFGESSGSFDASTGVWGPPPPYSPQGRSGSRHHLHHPDPAAATLLHHHHIDAHRNTMPLQDHSNLPMQSHTCARNSYMMQHNLQQMNPELARMNPELARMNPELTRMNPEMIHLNPDLAHLSPELAHLAQLYPPEELARLQTELGHIQDGRFNTLRGHLVPYRGCQRSLGMSVGNLHRDCRMEDSMTIECLHQKSASKVSDQSSDSCQKLGKENLAFTNDKNSPVRRSMQLPDCHRNAESEVYFADVSSCCNVSVKADCCTHPAVSALVGTIENHPESTSESDTGSFTLTRQQRPQPQQANKRRPRQEKHAQHLKTQEKLLNNSLRLNELNNSIRLNEQLNSSIRLTEQQIEQLNNSMRMSERMERNDSRDRLNERIERLSDRERERMESREKINESRISDRMNDSRLERMNDSRLSDRMSHSRISDRANESRISDRMNDSRTSDRLNDSKMNERIEERRMSDLNSSMRMDSPMRMARSSPKAFQHPRQSSADSKEFFVTPNLSPLSPKTEESLLSDDDRQDQAYNNEPESSRPKSLGPDSQYETVREEKEETLKTNHHHCYSDTNTMDSGWQSGSEKQVTD